MGKIYIPITGSPEGKKAYKKALSFAKNHNFEVVFLAVLNIELVNKLKRYNIFIEEEVEQYNETMKKDVENYLNKMVKEANSIGIEAKHVILKGDPYHEILHYVKCDDEVHKVLFIPKKLGGEGLKDIFAPIERRLLLTVDIDILVIGEEI
ncbi:MAG: universal stress protein [Brevinematia bacterium]